MSELARNQNQLKAAHMEVMLAIKGGFKLLPLDLFHLSLDRSTGVPVFRLNLRSDLTHEIADLQVAVPQHDDSAQYRRIDEIERGLDRRGLYRIDRNVSAKEVSYLTDPAVSDELRAKSAAHHHNVLAAIGRNAVTLDLSYIGLDGRDIVKDGRVGLSLGVTSPMLETDPETGFLNLASIDVNASRYQSIEWTYMLDAITSRPMFPGQY
jgi:hypothetical protein